MTSAAQLPPSGTALLGVHRADEFAGQIALTFDDGPSPVHTPRILDVLAAAGVKATFYVQGLNAVRWPDVLRRVHAEGHVIGNHSWDHPDLTWLTAEAAAAQIRHTQQAVEDIVGETLPRLVRPPYGSPFLNRRAPYVDCWPFLEDVLRETESILMMWHVGTWDWKYQDRPDLVVERFIAEMKRVTGGIVLMHDVHAQAASALPGILDVIHRQGLRLVRDIDLLQQKYQNQIKVTQLHGLELESRTGNQSDAGRQHRAVERR